MKQTRGKARTLLAGIGAGTALVVAGSIAGAGAALFSIAIDTKSPQSLFRRKSKPKYAAFDATPLNREKASSRWFQIAKQSVGMRTTDGLRLHAWMFDPDTAVPRPHCYAICCHGYTGEPAEMAPWAYHYAKMGFKVLVPAQRAHELSEGRYTSMGWMERLDLLAWIRTLISRDPEARILLHGNSMGAAEVMMACGETQLPHNVVAGISDSGFTSENEQLLNNVSGILHMPQWMSQQIVDVASLINKVRLGFTFRQASAVEQLKHVRIPMLFIQGANDRIVDPKNVEKLYQACASTNKQKLVVANAGHTLSVSTDPKLYWKTVDDFIAMAFRTL